jgi:hypothetical protein
VVIVSSRVPRIRRKIITRAPPAGRIANENAAIDEKQNIASGGRILGTLGKLGVFRCGELALKAIKQAVQNEALALLLVKSLNPDVLVMQTTEN